MREFDQRFEEYMRGHTSEASRWMHVVGMSAAAAAAVVTVRRRRPGRLWTVPAAFFAFAWSGHFVFERNLPVGFTDPGAAFSGDLKMIYMMATGRGGQLKELLARLAEQDAAAEFVEDTSGAVAEGVTECPRSLDHAA
ncbi:Mpo1-like protein [Streptomyces sp. NPDC051555]|uniref:Mpo1-like protein n=1 Tax=Streptomyces sp. NPDC051555 TaxID=3365657 RepID=UPI00379B2B7D